MRRVDAGLVARLRILGFEFRARSIELGFRISGFGFRVPGSGVRISGSEFWVAGFWFRITDSWFEGLGLQVWSSGFRVSGLLCFLDCDCHACVHLRSQACGFRRQGLGFMVWGLG